MASTDARPIPLKNTAYRITFPILDADGDLVTGAAAPDSEVSIDGGTFTDCTNEATEIATSSGIYYLDLTSSEMNGDTIAIIVKTSTTGAKTTPIVLYPQELGDIQVNVTYWNGTAVATPDTAGYPKVTIKSGTGTGEVSLSSGVAAASLSSSERNAAADAIMVRASSNWEASAGVKSLGAAVMKAVHRTRNNAGTLEIYRSNSSTLHASQTLTTDASGQPIKELTGAA